MTELQAEELWEELVKRGCAPDAMRYDPKDEEKKCQGSS